MIKKSENSGFTLVEVAIVLVIGGILLAAAASLIDVYIEKSERRITLQRLDAIDEAIQTFLASNGRYPCPAVIDRQIDDTTDPRFGFEDNNCTNSATVREGAVPTRTLNLPDNFIADAWGNRFTYAVTDRLAETTGAGFDLDNGVIGVIDGATPIPNSVIQPANSGHYVIISHGQNGFGSHTLLGVDRGDCALGGPNEVNNCDGLDNTYVSTLNISTSFGPQAYDDYVRARSIPSFGGFVPKGSLIYLDELVHGVCPTGWQDASAAVQAGEPVGFRSCVKQ